MMETRALIQDLLPGRRWLALAAAVALIAGVATPPLAQAALFSRWTMPPNAEVRDIALDTTDALWIQTNGVSGLRKLVPLPDNMLTTYTTDGVSHEKAIAVDDANKVWSPGSIPEAVPVQVISRLDPGTLELTSWPAGLTAVSIVAGTDGKVWFANATNTIARLDPGTNVVTSWALPFDITLGGVDASNRPWFSYVDGSEWGLARLDPGPQQLTNWPVATSPDTVQRPFVDSAGNLWAARTHSGADEDSIIRLEPATSTLTEWTCRPGCDQLTDVVVEIVDGTENVWFTEDFPTGIKESTIGRLRLAPATPPEFKEWVLTNFELGGATNNVNWGPRTLLVDANGRIWMRVFDIDGFVTRNVLRLTP